MVLPRREGLLLTRRALLAGLGAAAVSCRAEPHDGPPSAPSAPSAATRPPPLPGPTEATTASASPSASAPSPPAPLAPRGPEGVVTRTLGFAPTQGGPQQAVLVVPAFGAAGERFPLLVALGGLGETRRGMEAGASGWVKDYWLDRAMTRLRAPPLTSADFQDLVEPARLAAINASLAARPFRGLVVACPYTPDLLARRSLDNAGPFAHFVTTRLLPRVRAEAPVLDARAATGIDGVSLGGRVSLLVALEEADVFGAVGVMQGAFEPDEVAELAARTAAALRRGGFRLRLLTSDHDFYREAITALHAALSGAGAAHEHRELPGPHAYRWNRGPGAIEMLLWHDRVLRGEEPEP